MPELPAAHRRTVRNAGAECCVSRLFRPNPSFSARPESASHAAALDRKPAWALPAGHPIGERVQHEKMGCAIEKVMDEPNGRHFPDYGLAGWPGQTEDVMTGD